MLLINRSKAGKATQTINSQTIESVFMLGHSLIGHRNPNFVNALSLDDGVNFQYNYQWNPGGQLGFHLAFTSSFNTFQSSFTKDSLINDRWDIQLANGVDAFVFTEAVDDPTGDNRGSVQQHINFSNTFNNVNSFYDLAIAGNPNCDVYLLETAQYQNFTFYTDYADWAANIRGILKNDWDSIITNSQLSGKNVKMIYGGQAIVDLHEEILQGNVPGMTSIADVYDDTIHPNDIGFYYLGCLIYSYLYKKSPVGLVYENIDNRNFGVYQAPTAQQAAELQRIAYESYLRHGE